jgi:hypothetical protein
VPQRHEHLKKAQNNESLAGALNITVSHCAEWAVTMLFYSALHYVDSFLAGKETHPLNHDSRDSEIENNGTLTGIYKDYRRLKDMSRAARYEIPDYSELDVNKARARLRNIKNHLSV